MIAAERNVLREERIQEREKARSQKIVSKVQDQKSRQEELKVELEATKLRKRIQEKERAQKQQEELENKKLEWERLEKLREQNISKKESEWRKREQARQEDKPVAAS